MLSAIGASTKSALGQHIQYAVPGSQVTSVFAHIIDNDAIHIWVGSIQSDEHASYSGKELADQYAASADDFASRIHADSGTLQIEVLKNIRGTSPSTGEVIATPYVNSHGSFLAFKEIYPAWSSMNLSAGSLVLIACRQQSDGTCPAIAAMNVDSDHDQNIEQIFLAFKIRQQQTYSPQMRELMLLALRSPQNLKVPGTAYGYAVSVLKNNKRIRRDAAIDMFLQAFQSGSVNDGFIAREVSHYCSTASRDQTIINALLNHLLQTDASSARETAEAIHDCVFQVAQLDGPAKGDEQASIMTNTAQRIAFVHSLNPPDPEKVIPIIYAALADGTKEKKELLDLWAQAYPLEGNEGVDNGPRPSVTKLGSGSYHYQFTLKDFQGKPKPNTPFELRLLESSGHTLPFLGKNELGEEEVGYNGYTDVQGRTPVIYLGFQVEPQDWSLLERFGHGPYGHSFQISQPPVRGKAKEVSTSGYHYVVAVCGDPILYHVGRTDSEGNTVVVQTSTAQKIFLYKVVDEVDMEIKGYIPSVMNIYRSGCEKPVSRASGKQSSRRGSRRGASRWSAHSSAHGTIHGLTGRSTRESTRGSAHGTTHRSTRGSKQATKQGTKRGATHSSKQGTTRGTAKGSARGASSGKKTTGSKTTQRKKSSRR